MLALLAVLLTIGAPSISRADVLAVTGEARIYLEEVIEHGRLNPSDVRTEAVDLEMSLWGSRVPEVSSFGQAIGTATIRREDGSITTIPLQGSVAPPEGSGGEVLVTGAGDDGGLYCFRIVDQIDAPTPRSDAAYAVVEPLTLLAEGHLSAILESLEDPIGQGIPFVPVSNCGGPFYRALISGDFAFSTVL